MPRPAGTALASWERDRLRATTPDLAQALRIVEGLVDLARRFGRWPATGVSPMSTRDKPAGMMAALARSLDAGGIDYMLTAGWAILRYAETSSLPRYVDITVAADLQRLGEVGAAVVAAGLRLAESAHQIAREYRILPCEDDATGLRADLRFLTTPFELEAVSRASAFDLDGQAVKCITAEDLVVQKVVSGRIDELDDVYMILVNRPALDRAHVRRWLSEFEVALERPLLDDFARLVAQADAG